MPNQENPTSSFKNTSSPRPTSLIEPSGLSRKRAVSSFKRIFLSVFAFIFFVTSLFAATPELVDPLSVDRASHAMVVTAHPLATDAALEILQSGGNAVDAAIAAQWVLNVVEPQSSGIGGGGFFLYFNGKKRSVHTFDGREKAPFAATPEMFLDDEGEALRILLNPSYGGLSGRVLGDSGVGFGATAPSRTAPRSTP